MKKILLIGGAGYIGTVVAKYLLDRKFEVKIFDNLIYNSKTSKKFLENNPNIHFVNGDILQIVNNKDIFDGIDAVVLLAGLVGDPITTKYPDLAIKINTDGNKLVINESINTGINKLIYISTCSNYGLIPDNHEADENYKLNPISSYAKSKVEIESYLLNKENENFSPTVLRFATAFGMSPRMRLDLTINEFIYEMVHKKELLVYDPDTWRPYCHVLDFARLIHNVINDENKNTKSQIFNAGSNKNNFTKRQIVELISKYIKNCNVIFQEKGSDPRNYKVNFDKVNQYLNFETKYDVEDNILNMINSIKDYKIIDKSKYGNYQIQ
jgi:nucleoside-diphosphate-sugar epimerase